MLSPQTLDRPARFDADPTLRRRTPRLDDLCLASATQEWLAWLPPGVRPLRLPVKFPRIANDIACLWDDPGVLDLYFCDLMVDTRRRRAGFAPIVREELQALRAYSLRNRPRRERPAPGRWA